MILQHPFLISVYFLYTIPIIMKVAGLVLALASSAAAFAPASQRAASTSLRAANLEDMEGSTMPFKAWDPFQLADLGSDETLAWFRAAELKNGRVAMLATTGYIVQAAGLHFPGMLSSDVSFASLSAMKPFDAWVAVPELGTLNPFENVGQTTHRCL
jgi:uncharacterized protein (DUF3820 family)